jgi:hypothetical protein
MIVALVWHSKAETAVLRHPWNTVSETTTVAFEDATEFGQSGKANPANTEANMRRTIVELSKPSGRFNRL